MNNICIVFLASPKDNKLSCGDLRLDMFYKAYKNITDKLKLDVIIFHEDYTEDIFNNFKKIYNNVKFQIVDFKRPDLDFNKYLRRPKGYMMMCRFFSGVMQNMEILEKYDSYIRFDDDSFLIEPFINQDIILNKLYSSDYSFRTIFFDYKGGENLLEFTLNFCKENNLQISNNNILNQLNMGLCPYNNFHYSTIKLWKHPIIKKYIDEIESIGGILLKGWMDANIHAMIIWILCPSLNISVKEITNFGYRHNQHFSIINSLNFSYKGNVYFYPK